MTGDEAHPFDARRIWMSKSTPDLRDWSVVSLVTALRAILQQGLTGDGGGPISQLCPDTNQRLSFLQQVIEELNDRGLDADSLVRYGLLREVLSPVLGTLLATHLLDEDELGLIADRSRIDVAAWQRAFRVSPRKVDAADELSEDPANVQATIKHLIVSAVADISNRIGQAQGWLPGHPDACLRRTRNLLPRQRARYARPSADPCRGRRTRVRAGPKRAP